MRTKALRLVVLLGFAVGAAGCGVIQVPMTLALGEGSAITIAVRGAGPGGTELLLGTTNLEGGLETTITADIDPVSLFRDHMPILGVMEISDLLFGGSEFDILGIPTGTVCAVPDPNGALGGTALIGIFDDQGKLLRNIPIDFSMDLDTAIKVTNPDLAAAIPDGFPFTISVSDEVDLRVVELLAVMKGNADDVVSIAQTIDVTFVAEVLPGLFLPLHITGQLNFSSANEFPTGVLLDSCIEALEL